MITKDEEEKPSAICTERNKSLVNKSMHWITNTGDHIKIRIKKIKNTIIKRKENSLFFVIVEIRFNVVSKRFKFVHFFLILLFFVIPWF